MSISFYEKGIRYSNYEDVVIILYKDIVEIKSYLTTELCSQVGATENLLQLTTMGIITTKQKISLLIPFIFYSAVLITLNDCKQFKNP